MEIGLLLPCNVIVYEADDSNKSVISAVDAKAMLSVVGSNPTLDRVASEVNERLQRVVSSRLNAIAATLVRAGPRTSDQTFAAQNGFVHHAEAQPVGDVKQVSRIAY